MSGHSKWSTIKRAKESIDAKRSSTFSRLSKEIALAARLSNTSDVSASPLLKVAVDRAKAENMPNDKISYAIKRGLGVLEGQDIIQEKTYEAYGPSGVGFLIDVETDNPNRSITEVRTVVQKNGGKMANEGSISWQFSELGYIVVGFASRNLDIENVSLELLEIEGIEDVDLDTDTNQILIYTKRELFQHVFGFLKNNMPDLIIEKAELVKDTSTYIDCTKELLDEVFDFQSKIEEVSDVVRVWNNSKEI